MVPPKRREQTGAAFPHGAAACGSGTAPPAVQADKTASGGPENGSAAPKRSAFFYRSYLTKR